MTADIGKNGIALLFCRGFAVQCRCTEQEEDSRLPAGGLFFFRHKKTAGALHSDEKRSGGQDGFMKRRGGSSAE